MVTKKTQSKFHVDRNEMVLTFEIMRVLLCPCRPFLWFLSKIKQEDTERTARKNKTERCLGSNTLNVDRAAYPEEFEQLIGIWKVSCGQRTSRKVAAAVCAHINKPMHWTGAVAGYSFSDRKLPPLLGTCTIRP